MKNGKKVFKKYFVLHAQSLKCMIGDVEHLLKKAYQSMVNYLREHPNNMKRNDLKVSKIN